MKFEEKLITLRKKSFLSQEALAEKLDVTRQTVSKWELGQSKPDMDKLIEMSKLFNVSIDMLTDDSAALDEKVEVKGNNNEENMNEKNNEENNSKNNLKKQSSNVQNKFVLYILILILILSLGTLVVRLSNNVKQIKDKINAEVEKQKEESDNEKQEILDKAKEVEEKIKKEQENQEKKSFNRSFEVYQGTETKTSTSLQIDEVIENNNKNKDHLVEVAFDGTSYGTDPDSIRNIKNSLNDFKGYKIQYYEIALYYDDNGYVNKITIETK